MSRDKIRQMKDMLNSGKKSENVGRALGYLYKTIEMLLDYLEEKEVSEWEN